MEKSKAAKLLVLLLILVVGMSLLTACGPSGNGEGEAEAPEGEAEAPEVIVFPTKPIVINVSYAAGGGTDLLFRTMVPGLEEELGVSFTVVNKPGAGGATGLAAGANDTPDGYSITSATPEIFALPLAQPDLPFTEADFKAIANINTDFPVLAVTADAPYDTLDEFVQYAKDNPGEISIGNSGLGGLWHYSAANLAQMADIELTHVPFEGGGPAAVAAAGGHISGVTISAGEVKAQVDAGQLKILCILGYERFAGLPDVPTAKELGYGDVFIGMQRGFVVPKDTPDEVVAILEAAILKVAQSDEVVNFMNDLNFGIGRMTGAELEADWAATKPVITELGKQLGLIE